MKISAYFYGEPGDVMDKAVRYLFEELGGRFIGSGTMLVGTGAGERNVQYDVPDENTEKCKASLKLAGFRLKPTP